MLFVIKLGKKYQNEVFWGMVYIFSCKDLNYEVGKCRDLQFEVLLILYRCIQEVWGLVNNKIVWSMQVK